MIEGEIITVNNIEYTLINRGRSRDKLLDSDDKVEYISRVSFHGIPPKRVYWLARCIKCKTFFIIKNGSKVKCPNLCMSLKVVDIGYQNRDILYKMYIEDGLSRTDIAIYFNISSRTVDKWLTEKNNFTEEYRNSIQTPSLMENDLIIGSILGDGHIDKRDDYPIFIVSHAENQKEYLYWKYSILKRFCLSAPQEIPSRVHRFGDKNYVCQKAYRLHTRSVQFFSKYRDLSTEEIIMRLNEFSLSILVLDDGYYTKSHQWELCLASMSDKEKAFFIEKCHEKFGIVWYITNYDDRYLKLTVKDSKIMTKIILSNIPNDLDVVQYKIILKGGDAK